MNTPSGEKSFPRTLHRVLTRALVVAGFLFAITGSAQAQIGPGGGSSGPTNIALETWTFYDSTNWTSDDGYYPISFTNLNIAQLGDGHSLVVDTNVPAWLQYNIFDVGGVTNLTVDQGSVTFWFAPGSWASTNQGGTGPGEYGRLFEVGGYTPDSSYGWWSFYVDSGGNNLFFSAQTNDLSSNVTTYVTAPISWATNIFHFIVLTYCATNTAIYLDGVLATNGPGVTAYPGWNVLTNGFFIGSDSTGIYQAHGLFNSLATYNYPLDSTDIQTIYNWEAYIYEIAPWSKGSENIASASSKPSTNFVTPDVITGAGNLQSVGQVSIPVYGTNQYQVWVTNVTAQALSNGTVNIKFAIEGGLAGYYYDVFATAALQSPITNAVWAWMGQGTNSGIYLLNIPSTAAFLILGTPLDSDNDGLTDAYELLVSHTNPNVNDSNLDGILDGWEILLGLNPQISNLTTPSQRSNYGYTPADWLNGVTGIRSGSITNDAEGNVLQVSQ